MNRTPQESRMVRWVLVCFFLSGLTGLMYEVLWTRMIIRIIGGSPLAVSIVLTVFMAGLGLGSYVASRTLDRLQSPARLVRLYGLLELGVGIYCLVIPLLLVAFRPLYAVLYNHLFDSFMLYNLLTFIGCSLLLVVPVICMGATLPILCQFYVTSLSRLGTHTGRLYGLNTVGAALGALLCGFWLIDRLGMVGTLVSAVAVNVLIGLSCIWVSARVQGSQPASGSKEPQPVAPTAPGSPSRTLAAAALMIFAVSGFCAMAYEVIWTKLLGLIVGPNTYSFTLVLVTFITCLALGSLFFGWLGDRVRSPMRLLLYSQLGAAVLALGVSQILGHSQMFFAKLLFHSQEHFLLMSVAKAVALFAFMWLPTLCLGATFPLVGKIYAQSMAHVGRSMGFAYSINTLGAVLGSFCAGFLLIPLLGKERGLSLVVALQIVTCVAVAGLVLIRDFKAWPRTIPLVVVGVVGLVLCASYPRWDHRTLSLGRYHRFDRLEADLSGIGWWESLYNGPTLLSRGDQTQLLYYGDGIGGFTTVLRYPKLFGEYSLQMNNSGKPDASTQKDMTTQTLLAHLPMLFHANPKTVMVLGLASGVTAGEVLHYPVDRVDVLEISPQVVEGCRFFQPWNNNVLTDPRTNLIIQDARAHLQLTRRTYDVIISEPSNPWMAGLATLFTRDFFELARNRLNEGGMFVQFMHAYEMDWNIFSMVGRTFTTAFPNSLLVTAQPDQFGPDFLLVGIKGKGKLVLDNALSRIGYAQRSSNVVLPDPRVLYRLVLCEDLKTLFGEGPLNTDGHPRLEYAAPRLIYCTDPTILSHLMDNVALTQKTADIRQQITTDVDGQIAFAAYALSVNAPFSQMVDLSKATPDQKIAYVQLLEGFAAQHLLDLDYTLLADADLERRCRLVQIQVLRTKGDPIPNKDSSFFVRLAGLYWAVGMPEEAVTFYRQALQAARTAGQTEEARAIEKQLQSCVSGPARVPSR